jgi:hypothetical protein
MDTFLLVCITPPLGYYVFVHLYRCCSVHGVVPSALVEMVELGVHAGSNSLDQKRLSDDLVQSCTSSLTTFSDREGWYFEFPLD